MKPRNLFFIILLPLVAVAEPADPYHAAGGGIPADTLISLTRTVCYGTCPAYHVSIAADGTVTYQGEEFVDTKGAVTARIEVSRIAEALDAFQKAGFFALRNSYAESSDGCTTLMTDNPSATTSLRVNGKEKLVNHYYGCSGPAELKSLSELERKIDAISGTAKLVSRGAK